MKHLEYKGYTGTIEYSKEDKLLFGKVIGIRGVLSYEGATGTELDDDFRSVIDEYLEDCLASDTKPEKTRCRKYSLQLLPLHLAKKEQHSQT